MNTVYLLLGSNEGERLLHLKQALETVRTFGYVQKKSSVYETAAWGLEAQPGFLNMVIELSTELDADEILKKIQEIEGRLGRQRTVKWGQRTLDIDILFFNDDIIEKEDLKVPHPFIEERRFTLEPLNEIASNLRHPASGKTVADLLASCSDTLDVEKLTIKV
ncbi:MAG TPA: 2-amino-4-hydroxy-6-hydroxymethyldihydropteridine diphosphokinase [Flavipsychrobacter sp.]|jgi:2-amino-4-hydroxy-6-hydroxymethyldihydropteridine diphosphokinase|nr:2-amino-4-hydroxy-6-hydroxymethyldihydropteridine diphosphokinase [Flavipsychrobacter sp.]